jgi:hypothetical protein
MKARSFTQFIVESEEKWVTTDPTWSRVEGTNRVKISGNTTKYQILKFIYASEDHGRSYGEVLKYIIEYIGGEKYKPTEHRGRYASNLTGFGPSRVGILNQYCKKNDINRWVLTDTALIRHFDQLKEEGKIRTEGQMSRLSAEEQDAMKTLRELGININPWA